MHNESVAMLELAAVALRPLLDDLVFVGGATAGLYIDPNLSESPRPTDDVDCIVKTISRNDYYELEERLRQLGLVNHPNDGIVCRWTFKGLKIDVMPTDETILGFTNRWYTEGFDQRQQYQLPSGSSIHILPLPYFIASKFEALHSRGGKDWRLSSDLEDIITILDGCINVEALIDSSPDSVKNYIYEKFENLLNRADIDDVLDAMVKDGGSRRIENVKDILKVGAQK